MTDFSPLDNPIWSALTSAHQPLSRANGQARRYRSDISPLSGLSQATPQACDDLLNLIDGQDIAALFTAHQWKIPANLKLVNERWIEQLVCTQPVAHGSSVTPQIERLGEDDIPEMLALTAATKPGPFLDRTIDMGEYYGIKAGDGRLMAMAGERLGLDDFTEISAVCTHPDFRGGGLAQALVAFLAEKILAQGKTPFLHVKNENNSAKRVYEKLGFRVRCPIWLTVIARQ